ncbi:hypothetical protein FFI94_024055 [Rhodococcus sp. KBS0724]|uniref:hypothetical protein n=1 Tax=Rhodococcus sp. KBS0724 TaxID=1179674 RepID=UPI00110E3CE2|nr:hypothetical protein [Rhodococcus sp. KBS0724]TSD48911.1 hypothetical protein FFI94_024055 [Rhodococcus sp. KBS0724]
MTWGVGLDVGNTRCTAVIAVPDAEPVIIDLESVLHNAPDGTIALGSTEAHSPGVRRFLDRIVAPNEAEIDTDTEAVPDQRTRGEELVATALYCLVAEVHRLTDQPLRIVAAIPPNFSDRSVAALRTALDNMDLDYIELAPHTEALGACDLDSDMSPGERSARGAAILAVPRAPLAVVPDVAQLPEPEDTPDTTEDAPSRRPVYIAAAVAGLLTAAACALAVFIGHAPTTQVPEIRDAAVPVYAEVAEPPTVPVTVHEVPIQFPTAAPVAAVPQNRTPAQRYQPPTQDALMVDEFDQVPTEDESVEPLATDDYDVGGEPTNPVDPGTTDPEPVDPEPVDPEPVDPQPTDPEQLPETTP